ncbi:MAG: A/G-specific adenine glycosylase [Aetokthonos hydrillicola CCALA 1050]|jgi:A/G-specific adenine glycosylase|nr:A/G-specific adenine glycosylase [Aetokthonos hydrillicola CCALA 1050]MBW4584196.1 A/G-specific adenine glycosylase [Aetokthonos hydrillicola CCALA 1050]
MSQQTTLAVVVPKFSEFVKHLPTVYDLATCDEEKLRELWSGLGYYARARNLRKGAQFIIEQLNNRFPQSYREWLQIPGCGPYTAAVIASICFNEKVACVDGNVVRVVSRLLGLCKDVWSSSGKSTIEDYVASMIPEERPGDFNQAMMELGATVCRKTKPNCPACPLQENCLAFANNWIDICPPKKPRREPVNVELFAILVWRKSTDKLAIVDRKNGFLSKTVGFPLLQKLEETQAKEVLKSLPNLDFFELPTKFSHAITHHRISGKVILAQEIENLNFDSWQKLGFTEPFHWFPKSDIASKLSTAFDNKAFKLFLDYQKDYEEGAGNRE